MRSASAWGTEGSGAGVRPRNGLCVAAGLRGLRRGTAQPLQPSYIRGGEQTAELGDAGAEIRETEAGAGDSSVTSDPGCCCRDDGEPPAAQGTHPRWAGGDCLSALRARGGCAKFATSSTDRSLHDGREGHWGGDR
jgi:hypothetical protein